MNELPSAVHADIKKIFADGDALAERRLYEEAITAYNKAWGLVPAPQTDWEASTWGRFEAAYLPDSQPELTCARTTAPAAR
ncbi:hypothetical protein J7E62_26550 [Variovorax paradoxus]|nr:hypothetical protein [Variovorax paradoxus]